MRARYLLASIALLVGCTASARSFEDTKFQCQASTDCPDGQDCYLGLCSAPIAIEQAVWGNVLTYTFEGSTGQLVRSFRDRSGLGHDSLTQRLYVADGRFGGAAGILGPAQTSNILIMDYDELYLGNEMTVEFWIYQESAGSYPVIGDRLRYDPEPATWSVEIGGSSNVVFTTNDGCDGGGRAALQDQGPFLSADGWNHVAVVWRRGPLDMYVNGTLAQTFDFDFVPCNQEHPYRIGNYEGQVDDVLVGRIDELKISSFAKDQGQIEASMLQDPAELIQTCGDRVLHPSEACDGTACCQSCDFRSDGAACPGGACTAGVCSVAGGHVTDGLFVLYEFNETEGAAAADSLGNAPDLIVRDPGSVTWTGDGVTLGSATALVAELPATALQADCVGRGEVTVEAWVTPHNVTQEAARIAAYSSEIANTNFMLGQEADRFEGRVRTEDSGPGGDPYLIPEREDASTELTHLVLSHDAEGDRFLYVNGERHYFNRATGALDWDPTYVLIVGNEFEGGQLARPWRGTVHRLGIYCRALSPTEIAQNFTAGSEG